jgi:hypothetical protein
MTAILVLTTFVAFLVVDRFSNREAAMNDLQAAFRAETGTSNVQSVASSGQSMVASNDESQEDPEHPFQVRGAYDRRRGDRRGQSAA